ncbi:flagellar basal-body rod protein FlgG [Litorivicinus lipolyticus]|uniref:Flagellar basal-body rod protein FlgG n=1 Tax=Litorivicinus lipolyticus TaxID=418701 RepID=A0A5Q2QAY2_9GAMM|nr:flagellar basal-body rod protein FlgG [Litorivicinus lipolyticus]QGG80214.1 flagellar basal-body rod protein FlgG [Litorivicinus lipolyticus]
MNAALWVAKTGLAAQDKALAVVSNNLANVSTNGFKKDRVVFQDLLYQVERAPGGANGDDAQLPSGIQIGTGVKISGTRKVFSNGSMQVTGQALDVAINGRGFFQIQRPDGIVGYTRDGQFQVNSDGAVVTAEGYLLEPQINIPAGSSVITIGKDGSVSAVEQGTGLSTVVGNITLADFANPEGLLAMGGNNYVETEASGPPNIGTPSEIGLGSLEQGAVENSNVSSVEELVNMITTQRAYEMNSKVISAADQMLSYLNQQL